MPDHLIVARHNVYLIGIRFLSWYIRATLFFYRELPTWYYDIAPIRVRLSWELFQFQTPGSAWRLPGEII
jgi:hypothetical protein